jgi:hypothetical protein
MHAQPACDENEIYQLMSYLKALISPGLMIAFSLIWDLVLMSEEVPC